MDVFLGVVFAIVYSIIFALYDCVVDAENVTVTSSNETYLRSSITTASPKPKASSPFESNELIQFQFAYVILAISVVAVLYLIVRVVR